MISIQTYYNGSVLKAKKKRSCQFLEGKKRHASTWLSIVLLFIAFPRKLIFFLGKKLCLQNARKNLWEKCVVSNVTSNKVLLTV
jgi:hypothetical protein